MRSPRTSTRLIAALTGLALVGAGLVSLEHHVETRHEICAEHGELIHVDADAGVVVEVALAAVSDNPLDLDHGEHCRVAWSTTEILGSSPKAVAAAGLIAATPIAAPVDRAIAARLWHLAPKTSPPV